MIMSSGSTFAPDDGQGTPLSCNSTRGNDAWTVSAEKDTAVVPKPECCQKSKSDLPEPPVVPLNCVPLKAISSRIIAAATSQILRTIEA